MPHHQMVDDAVVYELGRIVVSSGLVERISVAISEIYCVQNAERSAISKTMAEIEKRANAWGVPEWARCKPSEVVEFSKRVRELMVRRNERFHAYHVGGVFDGEHAILRTHIRTGNRVRSEVGELANLVIELDAAVRDGGMLEQALMHKARPDGVYIRDRQSPSGMADFIQDATTNINMTRITSEEANAYWSWWDSQPHRPWPPSET